MRAAIAEIEAGAEAGPVLARLQEALLAGGFASVDYAELREADGLALLDRQAAVPARLLVAARIGKARLIDNMAVAQR
jgi:pantoate--beta-alanine ligase